MSTVALSGGTGSLRAPMLAMRGVSKTFGRARVLNSVDLTLKSGEVHALLGENGAGKSTLMKVLFGIVPPDAGEIEIDTLGAVQIESPRHALSLGIGLVSQELSLVPQLDVAQNIFLGQTAALDIVPRGRHREVAVEILKTLAPISESIHLSPSSAWLIVNSSRSAARWREGVGLSRSTSPPLA